MCPYDPSVKNYKKIFSLIANITIYFRKCHVNSCFLKKSKEPVELVTVFVPLDGVEPFALQVEVAGPGGVAIAKPETRNRQISQTNALYTWKCNLQIKFHCFLILENII
jgi:hypothetical protein